MSILEYHDKLKCNCTPVKPEVHRRVAMNPNLPFFAF